jgi:hypothetical protein
MNYRVIVVERPGHGKTDRPNRKTLKWNIRRGSCIKCFCRSVFLSQCWLAILGELLWRFVMRCNTQPKYPDADESGFLQAMNKPPVVGDVPLILGRSFLGRQTLKGALRRAFSPQPLPEKYFRAAASFMARSQTVESAFG